MSGRTRILVGVLALAAGGVLPAVAVSETTPTIEAVNGPGYYGFPHKWNPAEATVAEGGAVTFSNPSTEERHGLEWTLPSGQPTPICSSGVPVNSFGTNWQGQCTFSHPGTYNFRCTLHPGEMKGAITVPGTASATTDEATEATQTTATLNGTIKPEGNTTEYHFEYGTTTVSEHVTSTVSLGSADFSSHPVSAALTALTPSTKYHAELVAIYGAGKTTVLGGEKTFTTAATASAPTVATGPATALDETEATLEGTVDPGGSEATEYFFEYGTNSSYGHATAVNSLPADNLNHAVTMRLTGLTPGTEYHFRLFAKNPVGSAYGGDHTFITASPPPPPSSPPTATTSTTTTSAPTTTAATPPLITALLPPLAGPPLLRGPSLRSGQHGSTVRGSLDISPTGAGGRLEVDLLANAALFSNTPRSGAVRVGRLVRAPVSAGRLSFSVQLTPRGKHALMLHHHLVLSVKIALTPPNGIAVTVTRTVVVHA